jgi:hypothetical protein
LDTTWKNTGIISFVLEGCDADEVAGRLDVKESQSERSSLAQPVLRRFRLDKAVRASFAVYNTPRRSISCSSVAGIARGSRIFQQYRGAAGR